MFLHFQTCFTPKDVQVWVLALPYPFHVDFLEITLIFVFNTAIPCFQGIHAVDIFYFRERYFWWLGYWRCPDSQMFISKNIFSGDFYRFPHVIILNCSLDFHACNRFTKKLTQTSLVKKLRLSRISPTWHDFVIQILVIFWVLFMN